MRNARRYFMLRVFLLFGAAALGLSGCSQPMRTLMALGKEQDGQKQYVAKQRQRFKTVLRHAQKNKIRIGTSREVIIRRYGPPVLERDGVCLYRDPVDFLHSSKVYMAFDEQGRLLDIKIEKKNAS